jgi:hypothetical protein
MRLTTTYRTLPDGRIVEFAVDAPKIVTSQAMERAIDDASTYAEDHGPCFGLGYLGDGEPSLHDEDDVFTVHVTVRKPRAVTLTGPA